MKNMRAFAGTALIVGCAIFLAGAARAQDGRAAGGSLNDGAGPAHRFPALLLSDSTALIKSKQHEEIAEIAVRVGDHVERGSLLLRLVDDQERVEFERARTVLEQTQADSRRIRQLHAEKAVSDELLEKFQTDLQLSEADLELARIRLEERTIRAPFTGIIAERYGDAGTSVEIGDPLVRITALTPLRLEAVLPEDMLPALRVANEIQVFFNSPESTLTLPFNLGPVVVDPASGTFLLHVEVDNRDGGLVPGMSCHITIPTRPAGSR